MDKPSHACIPSSYCQGHRIDSKVVSQSTDYLMTSAITTESIKFLFRDKDNIEDRNVGTEARLPTYNS